MVDQKKFALFLATPDSEFVKKAYGGYHNVFVETFGDEGEHWDSFRVVDGEFPDEKDLEKYDGFVISGSSHDSFQNDPWILKLCEIVKKLDEMKKKVLGICFGHQIIARVRGGTVGRARKGPELKLGKITIVKDAITPGSYFGDEIPDSIDIITKMKINERKVRLTELILRCLVCALALVAAILIVTDTQVREIFTIQKKAKYTDMKALVFLVVVNGIAAAYSLVHVARCVVGMMKGSVLFSKPLAWAIFSGDQAIAYLTVAGLAAAAQSAAFAKLGQPELQWMKICTMYGRFCNQVGEGIGVALLASVGMVLISCISALGLFRLYGGNKAWQSSPSRW